MRLDVILRVVTKFILPYILLFALYVQFHGDYGPGGGFQAGVIVAAMVILYAIIFGLAPTLQLVPPILVETMIPLGVLKNHENYVIHGTRPENTPHFFRAVMEDGAIKVPPFHSKEVST